MIDRFVFDGVDSREFQALVFEDSTFSAPVREYTRTSILGRDGDLLKNNRRVQNIDHSYWIIIKDDFEQNYAGLRAFLLSRDGYCRLEDSIHPEEFYTAFFSSMTKPSITRNRNMGKFQVIFNRKPQRWLIIGDEEKTISGNSSSTLNDYFNPTAFPSKPLLMVTGTIGSTARTVEINNVGLKIQAPSGASSVNFNPLYIDCDAMEAYVIGNGGARTWYNNWVSVSGSNDFPTFSPGTNSIVKPYGISTLAIRPRWYTL